jgi:putative flippase GtrA
VIADERRRLVRFAAVGLFGYGLNLVLFAVMVGPAGWDHRVAAAVSTALALCSNFVLNRLWTFDADHAPAASQAWKFAVVSTVAIAVNVVAILLLVDIAGLPKLAGEALAVCCQAPVSYVGNRLWTFAGPPTSGTASDDAHYSSPA